MRKFFLLTLLFSMLLANSCKDSLNSGILESQTGSLSIRFDLSNRTEAKAINYDFSKVTSGKAYLQQNGIIKYQLNLVIDSTGKTGQGSISNIVIGTYDIIVELYDSSMQIIYSGTDNAKIKADIIHTIIIFLSKNTASLSVTGNWTEAIPDLTSAIVKLKKNNVFSYAGNLVLDTINKTVTGGISNIQPGSYDVYIEIIDTTGMICFTGTQTIVINKNHNSITLTLDVKTGSIIIDITGDVTAPVITTGPEVSINEQTATITWTTDENSTSNVCYSTVSGFDHQSTTTWAPIGQDLTADNTSHSVTIQGLVQDQTYYYVVVCADTTGNMFVNDEKSFIVSTTVSKTSPTSDLALNADASESDDGWGGGSSKSDITDGIRTYDDWARGLAFQYDTWHQAIINFGHQVTFSNVIQWYHGGMNNNEAAAYKLQYWNGSVWVDILETTDSHAYLKYPDTLETNWWYYWSTPYENSFTPVVSNKLKILNYPRTGSHTWLYEVEVY